MKRFGDGDHRLDQAKRKLTSILVTPLQPPFNQPVETLIFGDKQKKIALSVEDAAKVKALLGGSELGGHIEIMREADTDQVRIHLPED